MCCMQVHQTQSSTVKLQIYKYFLKVGIFRVPLGPWGTLWGHGVIYMFFYISVKRVSMAIIFPFYYAQNVFVLDSDKLQLVKYNGLRVRPGVHWPGFRT